MNKNLKLAVLATVLLFGTTAASAATTSSRSSYKSSSYKSSSYKPSSYKSNSYKTSSYKTSKPVKRKSSSSSEEIEYFALQDCQRHITLTFNGYRCIDRD